MKKLLPVILALLGLAIGTGIGIFLKPASLEDSRQGAEPPATGEVANNNEAQGQDAEAVNADSQMTSPGQVAPMRRSEKDESSQDSGFEYVKLNNQFVVPVVKDGLVAALVVMSLSIEVTAGEKENVFAREPKLRDAFLQVLFDHANSGGFDGVFTTGEKMNDLRGSLFQAAEKILGPTATDVLVIGLARQDI